MCSIIGYCGKPIDSAAFQAGFDRTLSRGPDDSCSLDVGQGVLGFHRLSIMGLHPEGMQPFGLNGSFVVCNGEIYGFEKLRQALRPKYTFQSDSDCEVLLPLYFEYGTEMFSMLDAELPAFSTMENRRSLSQPGIRLVFALCITAMTKTVRLCSPVNPRT